MLVLGHAAAVVLPIGYSRYLEASDHFWQAQLVNFVLAFSIVLWIRSQTRWAFH